MLKTRDIAYSTYLSISDWKSVISFGVSNWVFTKCHFQSFFIHILWEIFLAAGHVLGSFTIQVPKFLSGCNTSLLLVFFHQHYLQQSSFMYPFEIGSLFIRFDFENQSDDTNMWFRLDLATLKINVDCPRLSIDLSHGLSLMLRNILLLRLLVRLSFV